MRCKLLGTKSSEMIKCYFADYTTWQILLATAAGVVTVLGLLIRGWDLFLLVIPFAFLVLWLTGLPVLIYFVRATRDWKAQAVETKTIFVKDIRVDDRYTFKSHGVTRMGCIKYALIDAEDKQYLLYADEKSIGIMHLHPEVELQLAVVYLKNARLVLRMRILDCKSKRKKDPLQQWVLKQFRGNFQHYLK